MKIIGWNCNMAFRNKAPHILKLKPDILVISECEHPSRQVFKEKYCEPNDRLWIGENETKGLGIFSYSDYRFKIHENYDPRFKYVLPIKVSGEVEFILFAVWAMNDKANPRNRYIGQVWNAINHYQSVLNDKTILMGDFNSNVIWDNDKPLKAGNHTDVVNFLSKKNIYSTFHYYFKDANGMESQKTYYQYRRKSMAYHIDYCFASSAFIQTLDNVQIGSFDEWMKYSDHAPVSVTFNFNN
ncbi:endonuclease/exonuclease/phosphatase family protein [Paenibacillus sp. TRM 82003]|nr:endonuclease/exonuclease/phosphatase family protein [Paenibacillus sp. TRM 82003]